MHREGKLYSTWSFLHICHTHIMSIHHFAYSARDRRSDRWIEPRGRCSVRGSRILWQNLLSVWAHRDDLTGAGAPPDCTATVAKLLCCVFRRGGVSTMIPIPSWPSRTCWSVLYQAPRTGLRPARVAARHSRGRGRERTVECPRVVPMGSQGRGATDAHPGVGLEPRQRRPGARQGRRVRGRWNWRAGPARQCPRERRGARARRPHGPSQWAACAAPLWAAARAGDRSQADLGCVPVGRLRSSGVFLFPFWLKLLDVWNCVINQVLIQKWWKFLYRFHKVGRTQEK